MRERWLTLGLALAALALFYALFVPKPAAQSDQSRPLSIERGPDGLAGAARWLSDAGIPIVSLRERYDRLDALPGLPARGNVLLSMQPTRLPIRSAEEAALDRWLERGNTLVILAALDDTPRWAALAAPDWLATLQRQTGLRLRDQAGPPRDALAALLQPAPLLLEPRGRHPLLSGVQRVRVLSELPAARWRGEPSDQRALLELAQRHDDGTPVLWVEAQGAGQIILLAVAGAFSNGQIAQADNARLLANFISWSRTSDGRVLFDDVHQGLVAFYDPQAFFADPRLHRTLGWIVLLWLAWVLGAQSLRSREPLWQPLDETALIEASGRFFAHCVPPGQAARRLLGHFFNEIHHRRHEPEDGSAPWAWLAAQPGISAEQLAALRRFEARSRERRGRDGGRAARRINLAGLQNLLSKLRGTLA